MAIHLLGIRHHGPGSCRNVLEYLQELQPDLILLEGPAEAETLLPCVLNEQMEPPVALLAYQPDQPQNAVFYPFAEFSPEWQTIVYALRNEVPLRFFDLPLVHSMAQNQKPHNTTEEQQEEIIPPYTEILLTIWQKRPDMQTGSHGGKLPLSTAKTVPMYFRL